MNNRTVIYALGIVLAGGVLYYIYVSGPAIKWADTLNEQTINDSWGTWNNFYRADVKPEIDKDVFLRALQKGSYTTISINEFMKLNVENQRLERYPHAQTAEEFYPPSDRPRGKDDITSVNYYLATKDLVSPIVIARVTHTDGSVRLIKLDGVHRLIAAKLINSPIRIMWIKL